MAESGLLSAESAPSTGLALGGLRIANLLDGDSLGADSPKKAGRLQHLKMRVAVSGSHTVTLAQQGSYAVVDGSLSTEEERSAMQRCVC